MHQQDFKGDIQWIVVDDCWPETPCTLGQTIIHPRPSWEPGRNTQMRNMLAAFPLIEGEAVMIIEDDDYYAPDYLSAMLDRLDAAPLVGEAETIYYHVGIPGYTINRNTRHSSLFQTAFKRELIPEVETICRRLPRFADIELWREIGGRVFQQSLSSIGMKGLPGRPGIGIGHKRQRGWIQDPEFKTLRKWIGEDAEAYRGFNGN